MGELSPSDLVVKRERVEKALRSKRSSPQLERIETDLHGEVVLCCANAQLRDTLRRNGLQLVATHSAFARMRDNKEIARMLTEHAAIYDLLLAGDKSGAMAALEGHIRRALEPNIDRLKRVDRMPASLETPYLFKT
ncbi:MAG: FCD domain-containing protein [Bradyrhizobium sp.]|nr:MAG: FCD domain-containing protein [Bradyrhizobium sp.]